MKKFCLSIFLIFSLFRLFGFEMPNQFVEAGTGYVAAKNVEREFNPFNLTYGVKSKSDDRTWLYDGLASIQFSDKIFDFTISGEYFIPKFSWRMEKAEIDIGVQAIYHFQRYYDLYSENDFYIESIFRFITNDRFVFLAKLGNGVKAASVDILQRGPLWDITLSGAVEFNYYFEKGAEIYGGIDSHELYRYPLAYTPTSFLGFAWNFKKGFRVATDIGFRSRDWFVVAPYIDRYEWNLKARYTF